MLSDAANIYINQGYKLETDEDKLSFIGKLYNGRFDISLVDKKANDEIHSIEGVDYWKRVREIYLNIGILSDSEIRYKYGVKSITTDRMAEIYFLTRLSPTLKIEMSGKISTKLWLHNTFFTKEEIIDSYNSSEILRSNLDPIIEIILDLIKCTK